MDFLSSLPQSEVEIDRELLYKAVEMSQGDKQAVSDFLSAALRTLINKNRLEVLGFKETLFRLRKFDEVKKVYCKKIAQHEKKQDENTHLNNPHFCGVLYPSTLTEVFLTARGNLIVRKSVAREILFCNGQVVSENIYSSSKQFQDGVETFDAPRVMDVIIHDQFEGIRRELPESLHTTVLAALNSRITQRLAEQLDPEFIRELEL